MKRGKSAVSGPGIRPAAVAGPADTSQLSRQRMVNLIALGEAPLPVLAKPVEVEVVE